MKIENGRIKLDKRDTRIGNFVITEEDSHYKVQDINGMVSHRFHKTTNIGRALVIMMQKGHEKFLEAWLSVTFLSFSVVPDSDFLTALLDASHACIDRHRKDFYGGGEVSSAEDEKIVTEQKTLHDDLKTAKKDTEDGVQS